MVRPKKQSKRTSTKTRQKINKKVREHLRKQRKEAQHSGKRKFKKDPGVPNLCPFKEKVLKEVEIRKQKQEEEKLRQKANRQKQVNKKRNLETLQQDALKRGKEYERKTIHKKMTEEVEKSNGAPLETSRKAYYKEFKKVVDNSDVVLEVLDARDPLGCRCFKVEEAVLTAGSNKKIVLVLNKIDLVPGPVVEKWLKHFRNEFPTIAFKASTQTQKQHLGHSKIPTSLASKDLLSSSKCMGANTLMKLLGNYCRSQNIRTSITVGVVGFPNVGKSSLINSLKRTKSCNVGATPGVTKNMQEIQLDKHIKLLDSPGIVIDSAGTTDTSIILRNCVKVESLQDLTEPVEAILKRCNKQQVMEKYRIPDYRDTQQFLCELARRMGKLKKGGVPDTNAAAKTILCDWNSGKIVFYTHPPEEHFLPAHISAEIVQRWGTEFDVKSLEKEESEEMKNMKELTQSMEQALVLLPSKPSETIDTDNMGSSDDDCTEDSEDEELEAMDDGDGDNIDKIKKDMTVLLPDKTTTQLATKTKNTEADENEFNLQSNKLQKKQFKRKQKEKKKRGKPNIREDQMVDSDEDYDFEEDLMAS